MHAATDNVATPGHRDGRIAEIARSGITSAAESDRACMTQYFPKTLRTLYRGCRAETFNGFTNDDTAVSNIERQTAISSARSIPIAKARIGASGS
jgi:hypothetical protein